MNVAAVIQCTARDLGQSCAPQDYAIDVCRRCGLFDHVVLACPDRPDSAELEALARDWGVCLLRGSEFNVAERLLAAADSVSAGVLVRILLRQFYLDVDQVHRSLERLSRDDLDFVSLPADWNYALAGDVVRVEALRRAVTEIAALADPVERAARAFSPTVHMEQNLDRYRIAEADTSPLQYPRERSLAIRAKLARNRSLPPFCRTKKAGQDKITAIGS